MEQSTIDLLVFLSIPATFMAMLAAFIYSCHKSILKEDAEKAAALAVAKVELEEELKKPKYRIRFVDNSGEEHTTISFEPFISRYRKHLLDETQRYRAVPSKERADEVLVAIHEIGYATDVNGVTYPTCNLQKLFVEEAK